MRDGVDFVELYDGKYIVLYICHSLFYKKKIETRV